MRTVYLRAELEEIPELDPSSDEWHQWCDKHGFMPLNSGRRAWCGQFSSYLRAAKYLVYLNGELVGFIDESELCDLTRAEDYRH